MRLGGKGRGACENGGVGLVHGEGLVVRRGCGGFVGGHAAAGGGERVGGVRRRGGEAVDGFVHEGGERRVRIVHVEVWSGEVGERGGARWFCHGRIVEVRFLVLLQRVFPIGVELAGRDDTVVHA